MSANPDMSGFNVQIPGRVGGGWEGVGQDLLLLLYMYVIRPVILLCIIINYSG